MLMNIDHTAAHSFTKMSHRTYMTYMDTKTDTSANQLFVSNQEQINPPHINYETSLLRAGSTTHDAFDDGC